LQRILLRGMLYRKRSFNGRVQESPLRSSCVGERLVEACAVLQFTDFENFAAVEAFDVLSIVILRNQLCAFVLASGIGHSEPREKTRRIIPLGHGRSSANDARAEKAIDRMRAAPQNCGVAEKLCRPAHEVSRRS